MLTTVCCALSLSVLTGCIAGAVAAAGAGAAGAVYVTGKLKSYEPVPLDTAWEATLAGFKDMDLLAEAKEKDSDEASAEADGPGGKKVRIKLKRENASVTEINIRVGIFGNENYSVRLLERIRSHLDAPE